MFNKNEHNPVSSRGSSRNSAIALALIAILLPACADNKDSHVTVPDEEVTAPMLGDNINAEEVADYTEGVEGKTVTIRSNVIQQVDANTFTISNGEFLGGEEILVVNATGKSFSLPVDNTEIQVTGEVRKFNIAEDAKTFKLNMPVSTYAEYEDKPTIIAQSLALAPEPGAITQNPSQFDNKTVAVKGEIEEILDPMAFTLEENQLIGGSDLLVFNLTPEEVIKEGDEVIITGVIRASAVSETDKDYELTKELELQRKLEVEDTNRPVLIADAIFHSN